MFRVKGQIAPKLSLLITCDEIRNGENRLLHRNERDVENLTRAYTVYFLVR